MKKEKIRSYLYGNFDGTFCKRHISDDKDLMCPRCYDILHISSRGNIKTKITDDVDYPDLLIDVKYRYICPRCLKRVTGIELDSHIANAVSILNKKGYITTLSCEGHEEDGSYNHGFIKFKHTIPMNTLPSTWYTNLTLTIVDKPRNFIYRSSNKNSDKEKDCKDIEKWASTLPENNLILKIINYFKSII